MCTRCFPIYNLLVAPLGSTGGALSPAPRAALIAVLLFLLLELSEMGLNGGGRLLDLDGAQRGGGWHVRHGTDPVADVGV